MGILFDKEANVHFSNDIWMHTFQIRLPVKKGVQLIDKCVGKYFCSEYNKLASNLNSLQIQTVQEMNETIGTIKEIIPTQTRKKSKSRSKKAIFGFIGQLSKTIFGTATNSDVQILAQHINALTTRTIKLTKEMAKHDDHESSFISAVDKRISNIVNQMKYNHEEINLLQKAMKNNTNELEDLFFTVSQAMLNTIKINTEVKQKLSELK